MEPPTSIMYTIIEAAGRTAYKSEDKMTSDSGEKFVKMIIRRGHESVLEHVSLSYRIICDRGVSHEIVRHRLASYTQESTRYCAYDKGKFGEEITVIEPCFLKKGSFEYAVWKDAMQKAEDAYKGMRAIGCSAQEARSVLPNSLKTEIVMTANMREWRHFIRLRCSEAAHPQMQEIANMIKDDIQKWYPVLVYDL